MENDQIDDKEKNKIFIRNGQLSDDKIIEGDPDKIKTVIDRWKFTRKTTSMSPNWYLSEIKTN